MNLIDSLHAEIQFWEDVLSRQDEETKPEALERMQMAKLLAEQKLSLYSTDCDEGAH